MSVFSWKFLRELFSVETLDERFIPSKAVRDVNRSKSTPPKWRTWEFYFYALNFIIFVPLMIKSAINAGSPANKQYSTIMAKLSPGWMGRPVDNSDMQYSGFRDQIPILVLVALAHVTVRRIMGFNANSQMRSYFDCIFGIIFILALHGTGALKILLILYINYEIGQKTRSRVWSWVFGIACLFANELTHGYPLPSFLEFGSLLANWEVFFKCTMMRMLSFNIDYLEAIQSLDLTKNSYVSGSNQRIDSKNPELQRINNPRPLEEYNFTNYVGFCLYSPLYLAGPILTFNDYRVQCERPLPSITPKRVFAYAVRFVVCLLCMEFILHYIPVVAISETRAWKGLTPAQVSMVGFFNLVVIWLKLLLPWRFFRLWALLDGIDPPENMVRCVANNYSATSFWRSWHRSFHRWVVRYLYVPLGGGKHQLRNSLIVFSFVALWHDIELRLFVWGGLIVLFVLPEIIAKSVLPFKVYGKYRWYRYVAGIGAVLNIWMMLIANLVGFAVGVDGIRNLLGEMMHTAAGLRFTILCSVLLFVGVQVMFEYRERELRMGIDMKC